MLYRAYGLTLSSASRLPELAPARRGKAALRLVFARGRVASRGWRHAMPRLQDDGTPWLVVARRDGAFRMQFAAQADFVWQPHTRTLTAFRRARTPAATIRHLAIDQALPLVLGHDAITVLHASACVTPAGAVAFLGATGAGKSTIAAAFGASGCPVVADDAVVLRRTRGGLVAVPAYAGARLWPDVLDVAEPMRRGAIGSSSAKQRIGGGDSTIVFTRKPRRLAQVYVLAPQSSVDAVIRIERLTRRDSLIELIKHSHVLDVRDRGQLVGQLERLTRDCLPLGVRRIVYPHHVAALERVRAAVLSDVTRR